jgi:PPP family 3-phenylpropionic acid transporter
MGIFYFFCFGGLGALFPQLPLFLQSRFGEAHLAWLLALFPLMMLIAPPIWGSIADYIGNRANVLRAATFGAAGVCWLGWMLQQSSQLIAAAVLLACFGAFRAPLAPLADAITHSLLRQSRYFSWIRIWGSLGFAVGALVAGLIGGHESRTLYLLLPATLYFAAALAPASWRSARSAFENQIAGSARSSDQTDALSGREPFHRAFREAAMRPAMVALLAGTFFYYSGHAGYDAYYSLHLRHHQLSPAFIGIAWSLGVLCEVVVMLLAPRIFNRASAQQLLPAMGFVAAARWVLTANASKAIALLSIQPLHGFSFGLWYLCLVKQVQDTSPPQLRASLQGIASSAVGIGQVTGYLAGGIIVASWGSETLFYASAASAMVATLVYGLLYRLRE